MGDFATHDASRHSGSWRPCSKPPSVNSEPAGTHKGHVKCLRAESTPYSDALSRNAHNSAAGGTGWHCSRGRTHDKSPICTCIVPIPMVKNLAFCVWNMHWLCTPGRRLYIP